MNVLDWTALAQRYLEQRRALGYHLQNQGRQLLSFAHFLSQHAGDGPLNVELAIAWANQAPSGSRIAKARRLTVARGFARYLAVDHPETQIPPARLLGPSHRRLAPTIFSDDQVTVLLRAAGELIPRGGLRPLTMRTLLGLLAATGLRPGEAIRLTRADVDIQQGVVHIRASKFGASREVPLHLTATKALQTYIEQRDRLAPMASGEAFFLRDGGDPFTIRHADYGFRCLCRNLGWGERLNGRWPRLYDLRHTFVCHRLLAWYQCGGAVEPRIPYLATYLGHRKISATYWYLTAIPELMDITVRRFEAFAGDSGGAS